MTSTWFHIAALAIAFLLVFASGYRMSRIGKPYPTGIFTAHKLASLVVLAFLVLSVRSVNGGSYPTVLEWTVLTLAVFAMLATMSTGGFVSAPGRSSQGLAGRLHRVTPYLAVLLAATSLVIWWD